MATGPSKPFSVLLAASSDMLLTSATLSRLWESARLPWTKLLLCSPLLVIVPFWGKLGSILSLFKLLSGGVPLLPPTSRQLSEENVDANPLFKAVPALKGKLAWRALGSFETPVHKFSVSINDKAEAASTIEFWVKREDLASDKYGGNKVRTLQYILGAFEAIVEDNQRHPMQQVPRLHVVGSGGSNFAIATKVHVAALGLPDSSLEVDLCFPDEPEMDNTLNYLSLLSLPGLTRWGMFCMPAVLYAAFQKDRPYTSRPWVVGPGGLSVPGVLGQVGGALELAAQIGRGELPDPDGIVVAIGSSCTAVGLVLGIAIARATGMTALKKPGFRIYGQMIHHDMAMFHRRVGIFLSERFPGMIGKSLRDACAAIVAHGGPDFEALALTIMREELVIGTDPAITGIYGAHSKASLEAKVLFDRTAQGPSGAPGLWNCGHFTAKSLAAMLVLLREDAAARREPRRFVLWQTKSFVQPRGDCDEWSEFESRARRSPALKKWGVVGGITGHPCAASGPNRVGGAQEVPGPAMSPEQYRQWMTSVTF